MQIDEVVWQIINHGHCSYKIITATQNFCRNEYNATGLCTRSSCPLANSNYATILEKKGVCYLNIKTAERCHMPNKAWEVIRLDKSYAKALEQIDEHLQYWPKFLIHKCKQRLTKLRQMLNRIRRLKLKGLAEITPIKKKTERREKIREKKAEIAANLETAIEQELLARLKEGTYGEIYNYNPSVFAKMMDDQEVDVEGEEESEESIDDPEFIYDANEIDDEEDDGEVELNVTKETSNTLEDIEDAFKPVKNSKGLLDKRKGTKAGGKKFGEILKKKVKPTVEVEHEVEYNFDDQEEAQNA